MAKRKKGRFCDKHLFVGRVSALIIVASCALTAFQFGLANSVATAFAEESTSIDVSLEQDVFSSNDSVLRNYSLEDIIATQSFLLVKPYEGAGRVLDVNDDERVDVFDLCLMKRGYIQEGSFYDLACEMFSESNYETISEGTALFSENETINNRVIVKGYSTIDFREYAYTQLLEGPNYLYFVEFENSEDTEKAINNLLSNPLVMYAEKDSVIDVSEDISLDVESDIDANANSWGVSAIEADVFANYVSKNSNSNVKVAVIDTGVDLSHPFLKNRLLSNGKDFGDGDNDPSPYPYNGSDKNTINTVSHGTHVSGIIADCTRNTNISILPIKVMDSNKTLSSSAIISALYYARSSGCSTINCSFGTLKGIDSVQDQVMREVINSGVTIVASAGNDRQRGQSNPMKYSADTANKSPAHMSECIVVASIDSSYNYASYSCYGSSIDVAAPGDSIYSTYPQRYYNGYGYMSGTSMAAPHITAAAALIKSLNPTYSPSQIEKTLTSTCKDLGKTGFDTDYGYGIPKLSKLIKSQVIPTISLSSKSATIYKGQKFTITASVTPGDVDIKWTTSNSSVATVNNGVVTANSEGTATVTAFFTYNGANYSATCNVTVKKPGITISETSKTVYQTNTFTLNAKTLPSDKTVFWSSSNSNIVTVSNGVVTAVNPGTATITASFTYEGETYSASCSVTVKEVSIKLDQSSKSIYQTDEFTLSATATPSGQTINWSTSNSNVATVSNGKVIGVNPGTATITASFVYGGKTFSASCSVTVKKVSLELGTHSKTMIIGDTSTLSATTSPPGRAVSWESTNNMIVSVIAGKITAKAPGSITIKATMTYNGKEYSDSCTVTVVEPSVKINKSQLKISKNETYKLTADTLPSGLTVSWKSEDTSICTIDSSGMVTGKSIGNTMIYATITYGGETYQSSCNVIIGEPKVSLNKTSMTMYVTDTQSLIASVVAVDGIDISSETKSDIVWTTSNSSVATVDSNGSVKGIAAGTAKITAKYVFCGVTYSASCNVTVNGKPGISLNKSTISLYIGDTNTLVATVTPSNSSITWSSSNTGVAGISDGKITAISNGTATITASLRYNGVTYSSSCTVTVIRPSLTFDVTNKSLWIGDEFIINATPKPSGQNVTWTSSNTGIATVSNNGTVSANGSGTATITGKFTYGGNSYSASCKVTVSTPTVTLSSYNGSGSQNVWDIVSLTSGEMGYCVALPTASASPSGCTINWKIESGPAIVLSHYGELFIQQPKEQGVVKAVATITYKGRTYKSDTYTYNLSLYKNCTELNYFYRISNAPLNSTANRYPFNVPKGTYVDITEIVVNGDANIQGSTVYGKTTYNGETGWIIITYIP